MKKLLIKLFCLLGLINPSQVFLPYKSEFSDNKDVKYLFAFYFKGSKQIIPNTNIFIFYNITFAIYSLYLYCITYCRYDIELYCVGTVNSKGILNTNIIPNYICSYHDGLIKYDDYKRHFGDSSDIPFNKIEDVIIEFIIRYVIQKNNIVEKPNYSDDSIKKTFTDLNITSYDYEHFDNMLKSFISMYQTENLSEQEK